MKRLIFISCITICFLSNCHGQEKICYNYKDKYLVDSPEVYLKVYQDSNNLLFQVLKSGAIHDEMVFTNIDVKDKFDLEQAIFFYPQNSKIQVIELGIYGSTFGANQYLIIWNDGDYWNLSKTPFSRCLLIDKNKDNLMEFQEFDSKEHHLYKFSAGLLSLYQPVK